jgi:hypothetical protein
MRQINSDHQPHDFIHSVDARDAQLSDTTHSYSGKGVVRYSW